MINKKTDTDIIAPYGNQQLLDAAIAGDYQKTKQLLDQGVNPNEPVLKEELGWNYIETYYPLVEAIDNGHSAVAKLLIESGADVNVATKGDGRTPLHAAFSAIKSVIKMDGFDVHHNKADHELIRYLVKHGGNINAQGGWCVSPLLLAIYGNDQEMVEYLIANGADVNLELSDVDENESRTTALGAVVQENNIALVQLLLKHGAKPIEDTIKEALEIGNQEIILDIITRLLQNDAHTVTKTDSRNAALIHAAYYGNLEIVKLLLENGADINAKDILGCTALTYATKNGNVEMIELLMRLTNKS